MKKPEAPPGSELLESDYQQVIKLYDSQQEFEELMRIERSYPYWEKFKYQVKGMNFKPELLWRFVKMLRKRNYSKITISDQKGFQFKYCISDNIQRRLHQFDLNLGGVLEGGSIIPEQDKDRLLISSLMEEAIASSQLEGAVTTREEAKAMLRANRRPRNHSEKMILNNYLTIRKIVEARNETLTPELVLSLHKTISQDAIDQSDYEGRFRESNNVKVMDVHGEVYYDPPPFTQVPQLIERLCWFANEENHKVFIHPIVRGIILHFLIGYIHPFVDGNGRTARAIFYWYLISNGYWLVEYLSISRIMIKSPSQYTKAYLFTEYDENDLTYFIDFNLKSMDLALQSLRGYIQRKVSEKKELYMILKKIDVNERQAEMLRVFINEPDKIIDLNEVQGRFGVVYQTARTDMMSLEDMGYVKSKKVGKKLIYFKSDEFDSMLMKK